MKLMGSFKSLFNFPPVIILLLLSLVVFESDVSGAPNPWWDGRVCSWNIRCPYGYFCVDYSCQSNRIGYLEPIQRNNLDLSEKDEDPTTPFPFEPSVEVVNEEKSSSSGSSSSGASHEKSFSLDYDYKYAKRRL